MSCRLFDAPSPAFTDTIVKTVFSNSEIEDENLLSVFSPSAYSSTNMSQQETDAFRTELELDFPTGQDESAGLEELSPSVRVNSGPVEPGDVGLELPVSQKQEKQGKSFWCTICGKSCVSNKRLKQHKESHSLERPHACKVCDMRFKRSSEVTKHMLIHNDDKKHSCQFCQFKTIHKFALDMHLKRHFGEYKYKCDICDKGFYTKFDLTNHTILHSGDRPYKCHVCKLTFLYKNNLLYHKKTIHPDPDKAVESFKCECCDKTYQSKRSLLVHRQKRHSEPESHLCEVCGQSVSSGNALKLHRKKMHSSVFPCKCCQQVFDTENDLKAHFSSHAECQTCQDKNG